MITIKILGHGCANCRRLEALSRQAAEQLGVEARIEKVSDTEGILAYNVLSTPALVIDEKLVSSGRVPAPASIAGWIREAAALAGA